MPVNVSHWPHNARLWRWGRAHAWWGYITWDQRIRQGRDVERAPYAAWVPAANLHKSPSAGAVSLPRIQLDDEPALWPRPPVEEAWYLGAWDGSRDKFTAPPGFEVVTGPSWQDHATS